MLGRGGERSNRWSSSAKYKDSVTQQWKEAMSAKLDGWHKIKMVNLKWSRFNLFQRRPFAWNSNTSLFENDADSIFFLVHFVKESSNDS